MAPLAPDFPKAPPPGGRLQSTLRVVKSQEASASRGSVRGAEWISPHLPPTPWPGTRECAVMLTAYAFRGFSPILPGQVPEFLDTELPRPWEAEVAESWGTMVGRPDLWLLWCPKP